MAKKKKKKKYCVFTAPPGQLPAVLQACFTTKKAAQKYARRARYLSITYTAHY